MEIGVLDLQGDVREHIRMLRKIGTNAVKVKFPKDLENLDALIIPGGESTAIGRLMKKYKLDKAIRERHKDGLAIYGTCAGAIVLAKDVADSKNISLGLIDVSIERNAYGRQTESFETDLSIKGIGQFRGIFIRAPIIKRSYNGAEILSEYGNNPVMVRQNKILITTFHPELTDDERVHRYFLNIAGSKE